jgi:hypothetical protein
MGWQISAVFNAICNPAKARYEQKRIIESHVKVISQTGQEILALLRLRVRTPGVGKVLANAPT